MASPVGGSDSAAFAAGRDADDGFETESGSSYIGSDASDRSPVPCPWRTPDFHDQECSRFFDCPTHIVERRMSTDETLSEPSDSEAGSTRPVLQSPNGEAASRASEASASLEALRLGNETAHDEAPNPAPESPRQAIDVPLPTTPIRSSTASTHTHILPDPISQSSRDDGPSRPQLHAHLSAPAGGEQHREQEMEGRGDEDPEGLPTLPGGSRPSLSTRGREGSLPYPQQGTDTADRVSAVAAPGGENERRVLPEFNVPRWQPDAEVTYCPICHSQFNIFVRKHHCRKCGRVVCNSCSPHRIIIPHQYIVRPPGTELPLSASILIDGLGAGYFGVNGPSGGERVRLCNPCVPDPNIAPPQSPSTPLRPSPRNQRDRSSLGNAYGAAPQTNRYGAVFSTGPSNDPYRAQPYQSSRTRSITMAHGAQEPGVSTAGRRSSAFYQPSLERLLAGGSSSSASSSYPNRYIALGDSASSSRYPPQIAEDDECPICHRELPSRSMPDFEALRESHINLCIQSHSSYGSPRNGIEGAAPAAAPRRTGMYTYPATEKDCIDDAECTICLEEFTVSVPMARLECLCRFHRSCISAWFINHPGRCPVHQHDGFGY